MYKHVIFDIFGTLVRPVPIDPYLEVLSYIRKSGLPFDKHQQHPLIFSDTYDTWLSTLNVSNFSTSLPSSKDIILYDDVLEAFDFLHSRGISFSFMSNIARMYADLIQQTPWYSLAQRVFLSCDLQLTKPSIKLYQYALESLDMNARDVIFLGDSWKNDVLGPRQVGIASYIVREHTSLSNQLKVLYDAQ